MKRSHAATALDEDLSASSQSSLSVMDGQNPRRRLQLQTVSRPRHTRRFDKFIQPNTLERPCLQLRLLWVVRFWPTIRPSYCESINRALGLGWIFWITRSLSSVKFYRLHFRHLFCSTRYVPCQPSRWVSLKTMVFGSPSPHTTMGRVSDCSFMTSLLKEQREPPCSRPLSFYAAMSYSLFLARIISVICLVAEPWSRQISTSCRFEFPRSMQL